jgi:hypothetical protein
MKAIKMRIQKHSRPLVILLATVVAILTTIVVANATQTITTPNAVFITYSLAASTVSAPITPATNRSVSVMGCCTTIPNDQGVGQVSLLHLPGGGMVWAGLESWSPVAITSGGSATPGAHIVYLNFPHNLDIQVASADTIQIHNGSTATKAGNVTLIW